LESSLRRAISWSDDQDDVYLRLQGLVIRTEVSAESDWLAEAHVHYRSGMAFGGGKIDEAAFARR